jgi:hypothetical protein
MKSTSRCLDTGICLLLLMWEVPKPTAGTDIVSMMNVQSCEQRCAVVPDQKLLTESWLERHFPRGRKGSDVGTSPMSNNRQMPGSRQRLVDFMSVVT